MQKRQLFYEDIFKALESNRVKYLVIGGVAVNLYGVQRATGDIDLMLAMDKDNLLKFAAISKELGLAPKAPVKAEELADPAKLKAWRDEKNMRVFSFVHPDYSYIMIDIMTDNYISFEEAYKKRNILPAWGIHVSCVSLDDLIKLKEISGREQDLSDIEALRKYGKR
jgi:predicted nucleotidyltransferase